MGWTTFANGTVADADQVINNFYHVRQGSLMPLGGASMDPTNSVYNLGSSSVRWAKLYVNSISAAGAFTFIGAPQTLIVQEIQPTATAGQTLNTSGAWYRRTINTVTANTMSGATLTADTVTLMPGTYNIDAQAVFIVDAGSYNLAMRLYDTLGAVTLVTDHVTKTLAGAGTTTAVYEDTFKMSLRHQFTTAGTATVQIQYYFDALTTSAALSGFGLGHATSRGYFLYAEFRRTA